MKAPLSISLILGMTIVLTACYPGKKPENDPNSLASPSTELTTPKGNKIYHSPAKNFKIEPIPVNPKRGGRIESDDGRVTFMDDTGTFVRLDYLPLSKTAQELLSKEPEIYFKNVLLNEYIKKLILPNVPGSKVEYQLAIESRGNPGYFVMVDMPKGSTLTMQKNGGEPTRLNAKRGLYAFAKNGYFYVASTQRSIFHDEKFGVTEIESKKLEDSIFRFLDTVKFSTPANSRDK